MRTKQCLAALCLPLAFAACSNEDFVTETPSLGERGTVDVTINAQKPSFNDANTRMSINENNQFVWEKDVDMIGAAMADGATAGTIGNDVLVNYPFTAQSSATSSAFNAKSSISTGNYLFYYGYKDVVDRKKLDLSMPAQAYKVEDEKTPIQQAANQMKMISPIVNLANGVTYADAQSYNLNLSFVNLYTMVKVNIRSTNIPEGVSPKVQKITLNSKTSGKGFVKKAYADLTAIAGNAKENVVTPDNKTKQIPADKMSKALETVGELVSTLDGSTGISAIYDQAGVDAADKYGPAVLSVEGDLQLSETEPTTLYILAPKGTYNDGLELTVETSEGTYTRSISKPADEDLEFADDVWAFGADLNFKLDGTGNVVLPGGFDIANADDWNHAVDFMTNHAVAYINKQVEFKLEKDITIPSLPIFNVKISGNKTLTIKNDFTFNKDNQNQFDAKVVTLGVAQDATLTLAADIAEGFAGIKNYGTINVTSDQSKEIENYGTLNVNANATLSDGLTNGAAKTPDTPEIKGTINIAKDKTLTITTTALDNVAGDVNINGTLTLSVASTTNKATITVEKTGTLGGAQALINTGTVDNYGKLHASVTNTNGKFVIEKGSESNNSATITNGTVEVKDVTSFAALVNDKIYKFANATVTAAVNNAGEYNKIASADKKITNITLNGGDWTLKSAIGGDATKIINAPSVSTVTGITLNGASLALEVALPKAIIVEGTSSISAATALTITGNLEIREGAILTVNNNVTFNEQAASNTATAEIFGTLNVEAGAKLYFASAEVGSAEVSGCKLTVKGNTTDNANPGEFGVKANDFNNYGTVESLSGSNASKQAGKVSMPENKNNSAVFKGNPSPFTFS